MGWVWNALAAQRVGGTNVCVCFACSTYHTRNCLDWTILFFFEHSSAAAPLHHCGTPITVTTITAIRRTPPAKPHSTADTIISDAPPLPAAPRLILWPIFNNGGSQILSANPEIKTFKSVFGDLVIKKGPPRPPGG